MKPYKLLVAALIALPAAVWRLWFGGNDIDDGDAPALLVEAQAPPIGFHQPGMVIA